MTEEDYISQRLKDQIDWYDNKSSLCQKHHKRLRTIEIICAALIPFMTGYISTIPQLAYIVGALGVIIAIAASISSLQKYEERWIEYRTNCETLRHHYILYQTKVAPYSGKNAFNRLVINIESFISQENSNWSSIVTSTEEMVNDQERT